jgi:MerR family mercuric resistance operon transcriptional regulator
MQQGMTIGRLAKAAAVNVETVRYYQRRGLIDEPRKPPGGHRRYATSVVNTINFVKRAQQLGFSLAEVKSLLDLSDGKSPGKTRAIAERKLATLQTHIGHLGKMCKRLLLLIGRSKKAKGRGFCPIIAALSEPD